MSLNQSKLHEEYLWLLYQAGLTADEEEPSFSEKLENLHRMSSDKNDSVRSYADQTLKAIDLLSEMTGTDINKKFRENKFEDKTGELEESVDDILNILEDKENQISTEMYFNVFPSYDFNAIARRSKSGVICLLNKGLIRLLYNIAYSSCYVVRSQKRENDNTPNVDEVSDDIYALCSVVMNIIKYLYQDSLSYQIFKNKPIDPLGIIIANVLFYSMKTFIVAHEIGHIVLDHLRTNNNRLVQTKGGSINIASVSHLKEYEADTFAQKRLIDIDKYNKRSFPVAVGGLSFLTIHNFILLVLSKLDPNEFGTYYSNLTHPPSIDRLLALHKYLKENVESTYYKDIVQLNSGLWSILKMLRNSIIELNKQNIVVILNDNRYSINLDERV